jgi:integrase
MRPTLTKAVAESAKPEAVRYELKDTKVVGLRLIVQPSGHKSWAFRYTTSANEDRRYNLGAYDAIGLDDARKLADSVKRDVLVNRKDPAAEKAETRRKTAAGIDPNALFTTAWGEWQKAPKPKARDRKGWRSSTADRVQKLYTNELEPRWGKRRLSEIAKADVSAYLDPIAKNHPQGAARRLRVMASFFNWCATKGKIISSPSDGIKPADRNKRKRKLSDDELRWLWKACDKEPFPMGHIVRMLILTLARRNEVAGIRDREVYLGNRRTWILPASRAKNNHEHETFLTDAMIETIMAVPRVKNKEGYFFTTNGKTPFSGFSKAKKRLDVLMLEAAQEEDRETTAIPNWTLHDLRRTGATRMQRLGFEKEVVDCCLNHIDDDEYLQHDYADDMVKAFDAWSREVMRIVFAPAGLRPAVEHESPALAPIVDLVHQ